jgi:hypothetical protein
MKLKKGTKVKVNEGGVKEVEFIQVLSRRGNSKVTG